MSAYTLLRIVSTVMIVLIFLGVFYFASVRIGKEIPSPLLTYKTSEVGINLSDNIVIVEYRHFKGTNFIKETSTHYSNINILWLNSSSIYFTSEIAEHHMFKWEDIHSNVDD